MSYPTPFTHSQHGWHRSTVQDSGYAVACFLSALFFFSIAGLGSYIDFGRWGFMSAILMVLSVDGLLWFAVVKNDLRSFALKFAFVGFTITQLMPLGALLATPISEDYAFPWSSYLFSSPLEAGLGALVRPLSIAIVYLITRPFIRSGRFDSPIKQMLKYTSSRYEWFLVFAGIINLSYWLVVTAIDNPVFYIIRILSKTLLAVPFFVGLTALHFKRATLFWLGVMAIQLVISFLTGTRGAAFLPILFFLVGFVIGLPGWHARMRWGITVLAPACLALAIAGAFIGSVRNVTGRTDLFTALKEGTMIGQASDTIIASQREYRVNPAFEVFRRLTLWPDYVVPTMTPDPIPYRGFADMGYEIRAAAGIGIFALVNPNWQGAYYFGNIHLKPYGFAVHVDKVTGKKRSNVELPIQVDAFMRGGWLAAFVFTISGYLVLFLVERLLRRYLLPHKQPLFLLMLMFLSYIAYTRFRSASLVDCMRQLILEGGLAFVVYFTFDIVLKKLGKPE